MALSPHLYPITIAGVLNLVLAALLMALNMNHRANRAFALVMFFRAGTHLYWALVDVSPPALARVWDAMLVYVGTGMLVALLYFLSIYPRPRAWLPTGWRAAGLFVAAGALLWGIRMVERSFFAPQTEWFRALGYLSGTTFALAALVLARDARGSEPGLSRTSMMLISFGFAAVALQDFIGGAFQLAAGGGASAPVLAAFLPSAPLLAALIVTVAGRRDAPARAYLAALGVVAGISLVASPLTLTERFDAGSAVLSGVARLILPLLVTYALLRYQVFDLDLRTRAGFARTLVPAAFVALFFVVSELAAVVLSDRLGAILGILAAGLLILAIAPLQRFADALAHRALPYANDPGALDAASKESLYRDLARTAWLDGPPTPHRQRVLDAARERLGLSHEVAIRIDADAMREALASRGEDAQPA